MKKPKRKLAVKKDRLRVLTLEETEHALGGDPAFTHHCFFGNVHPNCPNDSRYCL